MELWRGLCGEEVVFQTYNQWGPKGKSLSELSIEEQITVVLANTLIVALQKILARDTYLNLDQVADHISYEIIKIIFKPLSFKVLDQFKPLSFRIICYITIDN